SLAGNADYSLSPAAPDYPAAFLREWSRRYPEVEVRFAILDDYVKAIERELETGQTKLETYRGDSGYTWEAFWMNMPEVKQYYRRDEHLLAAAELLSTAASLNAKAPYPSQQFYHSWINLLMNMDRNTIWGASAGMAFQDPAHWDAWDRFRSVEQQARAAIGTAAQAICRTGNSLGVVNALNWKRNDPVELELPPGKAPAKSVCESLAGRVTCILGLPPASLSAVALQNTPPPQANEAPLPASIDTPFYTVTIDPRTGALSSLKLKPTGEELLGGPANEVQMERVGAEQTSPEHFMSARPKRLRVGSSAGFAPHIRSWSGPLSTTVEVSSEFPRQSKLVRTMRFYRNHPRIDFNTRLDLGTSDVLVSVDFPLAGAATERTRGIPYGFADGSPKESVLPAIRWSNYQLATGSGLALLDRGLTGHEFNPNTLTLVFLNAVSKYMKLPNPMLEGRGTREFAYAIVPHAGPWRNAAIPRLAYEFNSPPLAVGSVAQAGAEPLLDTSPNVIVEAVRRVGRQLEVRLYETDGQAGTAELRLNLPHSAATLTNLLGEKPSPLAAVEPNRYRFPIRAQQIVTLRFATATAVAEPQPLRDWAPLVPENKRKALEVHLTGKGHPGGY
ncbi:MAG: hypothetical protein NTY38_00210, partial [Acidobacteria bacterium]|nr:hypothetical protein [Acidobacteriota bacterium]